MIIQSSLSKKDLEDLLKGSKTSSAAVFINVSASDVGSLQQSLGSVIRKNRQSIVVVIKDQ